MIAAVMVLVVGAAGSLLYGQIRRFLHDDLEARLRSRLAFSESVIEIDDGKLEFEARQLEGAITASDRWRLVTRDGKTLWESNWIDDEPDTVTLTKSFVIGDENGTIIPSASLVIVPLDHAEGNPGHLPPYQFVGAHSQLPVTLSVRESLLPLNQRLERIALAFWIFGPVAILALSALLIGLIRWQLAPLGRMSEEASEISAKNTAARIGPAGTSLELTRLRDSINLMVERLGTQLARERQFASLAAHELRTPLAHLRTAMEVAVRKERSAGAYRDAINGSLNDVVRLQALIENLLFVARHQKGSRIEPSISLSKVVEQARRDSGSDVRIMPGVEGLNVWGQGELLAIALRNVFENASRYAPGIPPVLNATEAKGAIELSVTDSGPGIPDSAREKIFEPLTRLDTARSIGAAPNGFGLGLTVARTAVKACGGELYCRKRADGQSGAEFVFELRKALASIPETPSKTDAPQIVVSVPESLPA